MNFKYIVVILLFNWYGPLAGQVKTQAKMNSSTNAPNAKLIAVASVVSNGISLRWAPDNENAWVQLNKYGYVVEKYTVMRDGKMLSKVEKRIFKIIKPMPLKYWDTTILNKDDYAAVIAQSLYGESFDMIMADKKNVQSLVSLSNEKQQRFAMAMYAADHSFKAARMAGLGWVDPSIKKDEKYLYRIYSPIPQSILRLDTAKVFIGLSDDKELPKPAEILALPADKVVMLAWEFDNYSNVYGSYFVERSDDNGQSFHRISERPVTKLVNSTAGVPNGSMVYSDTLTNNTAQFKYRIAGLTIFDEVGPYSDTISVKGITKIETAPHILGAENVQDGKGILKWQVEDSIANKIKHFEINESSLAEGPYRTIIPIVDVSKRSIELDSISSDASYITVTAVLIEGENKVSMPYLLQAEDSLAPAIPRELKAIIDSNGVVKLSWSANTEKDLQGYQLYKSFVENQELTTITNTVWTTNYYSDTVQLKNLNSKVFYSVRAVDKRHNQSDYAPILVVKKPDIIPPSQPVFKEYLLLDTAVVINWINSYDSDLMFTDLLRKELSDSANKWELVKQFAGNSIATFIDRTGEGGLSYAYTLISKDSSDLESRPALPLTISIPKSFDKMAVKKVEIVVNREKRNITISWDIATKQIITQIELYKAAEKEKISLFKILDSNTLSFVDDNLKINTLYQYGVRVVFDDGKTSDIKIKKTNY